LAFAIKRALISQKLLFAISTPTCIRASTWLANAIASINADNGITVELMLLTTWVRAFSLLSDRSAYDD
jgi:hypothetical protein